MPALWAANFLPPRRLDGVTSLAVGDISSEVRPGGFTMPASKRPTVDAHPLVKALVPDPSKPPLPTIKLLGLLGDSPSADTTRLWLDSSLTSYVDIPTEAIRHTQSLPDDGGTVVWVDPDAQLVYGTVTSQAVQASFLSGSIAATHLASAASAGLAAGPGGPVPTPPVTLPSACACVSRPGTCPTLPLCPSEAMLPSHCGCPSLPICPSEAMVPTHCGCPSLPICPSEAMPPSHCGPCPTHQVWCQPSAFLAACGPTHTFGCRPSLPCPQTSPIICRPSVHVICPTPSAVGGCPSAACPSVHTICPTPSAVGGCPSFGACPSIACGPGPGGGGGPVA